METRREDVGIAFRSAFLAKGTKQKFSLFVLVVLSILLLFLETVDTKPLNYFRSFIKDTIYRGSVIISAPTKGLSYAFSGIKEQINLNKNYVKLKKENEELKNNISNSEFLQLENFQLKKLVNEAEEYPSSLVSGRVMLDKQSPYLNSFILNIGRNKSILNGMAVLDKQNFVGRIVDVNFFSSRVLLISDLNSRIPVIVEPLGYHAILRGRGLESPTLEYFPEKNSINDGDKVYTSGREGIFSPGIPIGAIKIRDSNIDVLPFSELNQITYVNIVISKIGEGK